MKTTAPLLSLALPLLLVMLLTSPAQAQDYEDPEDYFFALLDYYGR